MISGLEVNPKYNGTHACPHCGAASHWTCISEHPVVIRVECNGGCGVFEENFSQIQLQPHFDKPVAKRAR